MNLGNTTRSARLLGATLGMGCVFGYTRPAQAEEPKPAASEPATEPRVFDGTAGFARASAYSIAVQAVLVGVVTAFRSSDNADDAAKHAAPLSRDFGADACRKPLAANASACGNIAFLLKSRDANGEAAVGFLVFAGVVSASATASIWLWRTPGRSYWIPDWFRVIPTAGPKSGGVLLQGSW